MANLLKQAPPPPVLCPTCLAVVQPRWNATPRTVIVGTLLLGIGMLLAWLLLGWTVTGLVDAIELSLFGCVIGMIVFTLIATEWHVSLTGSHTKSAYRNAMCPHCRTVLTLPTRRVPRRSRSAIRPNRT